jgi:hypothetical protein
LQEKECLGALLRDLEEWPKALVEGFYYCEETCRAKTLVESDLVSSIFNK